MKFPYGISDFNKIITNGYFYVDRTDRIPMLEDIVVAVGFDRLVWAEI